MAERTLRAPKPRRPWDVALHARLSEAGLPVALFVLLLVVPYAWALGGVETTQVNQLGRYLCLALVALGLDLLWGYAGILSLCQMLFFTLGGYCIGMHLCMKGPLDGDGIPRALFVVTSEVSGFQLPWFWKPFASEWFSLAAVVGVSGLAAFLFGWFAFRSRVRGVYFSIITQALTLAATLVFRRNELRLCGTNGLTNFQTWFGCDLRQGATQVGLYVLTVLVLAGAWLLCRSLVASRTGRVLVAVRDNESRLRFAGYAPHAFKAFAFTVAAILAAIGGMLYAPQNGIITPFKMEPLESIVVVVMVALGGRGTLTGAIVGAILVSFLAAEFTSGGKVLSAVHLGWLVTGPAALLGVKPAELWMLVLGLIFILATLFMPAGLVGAWRALGARINARRGIAP